jgi:Flp pilus assembly protein TadG
MKRQRGIVALELALVLPFVLTLLTAVLFCGRLSYQYEVASKAARDGARYLSSVAAANMKNPALAGQESNLALAIVQAELSVLGANQPSVLVSCDNFPCTLVGGTPNEVSITVFVEVPALFVGYMPALLDQRLVITSRARYVGN